MSMTPCSVCAVLPAREDGDGTCRLCVGVAPCYFRTPWSTGPLVSSDALEDSLGDLFVAMDNKRISRNEMMRVESGVYGVIGGDAQSMNQRIDELRRAASLARQNELRCLAKVIATVDAIGGVPVCPQP